MVVTGTAGPDPTLLQRTQVDALYHVLHMVTTALQKCHTVRSTSHDGDISSSTHATTTATTTTATTATGTSPNSNVVAYIITGGSLLGAVRQHSILFTDDDIDIAIIEQTGNCLQSVREQLPKLLGTDEFQYTIDAWEGSDRIRWKKCSNVFMDVFCIREYTCVDDLRSVLDRKRNGQPQTEQYVASVMDAIFASALIVEDCHRDETNGRECQDDDNSQQPIPLFPCWHFDRRKAIELWPKEVYRSYELFPIRQHYKMGPVTDIGGPNMPITLLHRAFGTDCFTMYYQSSHHNNNKSSLDTTSTSTTILSNNKDEKKTVLQPHIRMGGTWEGTLGYPLLPEHYIPMQPTKRSQRRHTLHDKDQLLIYLQHQSTVESTIIIEQQIKERRFHRKDSTVVVDKDSTVVVDKDSTVVVDNSNEHSCVVAIPNGAIRPRRTVYMDGVFDLFHIGHVRAIQQCATLGDRIILGVTGDEDAASYKRMPVVCQNDRVAVIEAIRYVDRVICPCPLQVTAEFLDQYQIDLVVHGFANDDDAKRQRSFFQIPIQLGKFQQIDYYRDLSTTDIIQKISSISEVGEDESNVNDSDYVPSALNTNWFGSVMASATNSATEISFDPFPLQLRIAMEPHIRKAREKQSAALDVIGDDWNITKIDILQQIQSSSPLAVEGNFEYDTRSFPLREALLRCCGFLDSYDLSKLHLQDDGKDKLLYTLTSNFSEFQNVYDEFVRQVCAPRMVAATGTTESEIVYQAFPCIRVVQPGEFSIGPHSDVTYGHHAGSINIYVPLTRIGGTAALFLESRYGSEDWHPIVGDYGKVKHFAGASCLHWTMNNTTAYTRVSLDFRLIAGSIFNSLSNSGVAYRRGFYCRCHLQNNSWERIDAEMPTPDKRTGFPWTIKDWDTYYKRKTYCKEEASSQ
jgi:cytidyltransferase-like protein